MRSRSPASFAFQVPWPFVNLSWILGLLLLEKSRIVTHAPEERNYHVFYEMLSGLPEDQRQKFGLMSAEKYFYLNQGGSCIIDGKIDKDDFQNLMSAMQVVIQYQILEHPFYMNKVNFLKSILTSAARSLDLLQKSRM